MNYSVQVFEIMHDAKRDERPCALERFAVGAGTVDQALRAVRARLAAEGRTVPSLSPLVEERGHQAAARRAS